ncbi:MAG: hypothetical protein ABIB65_00230, partial [Candidatus Margulisiibacteriota bacterium]
AKNLEEIMTQLVSGAPLPYYYNEEGLQKEEGPQLLKAAKMVREGLENAFPNGPDMACRDLDPAFGKNLTETRNKVVEYIKNLLEQEEEKHPEKFVNMARWERHKLPIMFADWALMSSIFDTDNITYREFYSGCMVNQPEYGEMLRHWGEVSHSQVGYKLAGMGENALMFLHHLGRDGSNHGGNAVARNNACIVPDQIAHLGLNSQGEATFMGYGDANNAYVLMATMRANTLVNHQNTQWAGMHAMSKVLGFEFYKVDSYKHGGWQQWLNYHLNFWAKEFFGLPNSWEVVMHLERILRLAAIGSGLFVGLEYCIPELLGSHSTLNDGMLTAFMATAGTWTVFKSLAHIFGRNYYIYQNISVPRGMEMNSAEDVLYTVYTLILGIHLLWRQGHYQQNDATVSLLRDMLQKLRWIAENTRVGRYYAIWAWHNINNIGFSQLMDTMTPCIYNNFGTAATLFRMGLWTFMFFGMPSLMMPADALAPLPSKTLLNWIVETAIINYLLIEAGIRVNNGRLGMPNIGTTLNFGWEQVYIPFYIEAWRRLLSDSSAAFNVTGPITIRQKTDPWGREPCQPSTYLRQNWTHILLNAAILERAFDMFLRDGIFKQDLLQLTGGLIMLWPLRDIIYNMLGMLSLNDGVESRSLEERFARTLNATYDPETGCWGI